MNDAAALITAQVQTEAKVLAAWFADQRFAGAWRPQAELFAVPAHRAIAEVCAERGHGFTEDGLVLELKRRDKLKLFDGGHDGVIGLLSGTPWVADPWRELERLRELNGMRVLRDTAQSALVALREGTTLDALQGVFSGGLRDSSAAAGANMQSLRAAMAEAYHDVTRGDRRPGCITGSAKVDYATGGIRPELCWVVGAETSWGKSAWGLHVADLNMALGRRVLVVTCEDPPKLYGRRMLARRARVNAWRLRDNNLSAAEHSRIAEVIDAGEAQPSFLRGIGVPAERIAADIRSAVASEGVELVLVDYVQAMRAAKDQARREEVGYCARIVTDAIKSSGAAGVIFSQITIDPNKKRPDKHSIRENKDVANEADAVLLGYFQNEDELDVHGQKTGRRRTRWVHLDKNKDGPAGANVELGWNPIWAGFEIDEDYDQRVYDMREGRAEAAE